MGGFSQGFGTPFHPAMNYYPGQYPQTHYQHPSMSGQFPTMTNSQYPTNDPLKGIPQRKIEFFCLFTRNDPAAKQKKIQISQFPSTISGFVLYNLPLLLF